MVAESEKYPWSSAPAHCEEHPDPLLEMELWTESWNPPTWREYLRAADADVDLDVIRRNTHTGRPLGGADFVTDLEKSLHRRLAPAKGRRPHAERTTHAQQILPFV
jgi:hypothetical protein